MATTADCARPSREPVRAACRAAAVTALIAALVLGAAVSEAGGAPQATTLFRVFLSDGTSIPSYGESARAGDRVVFSVPVGSAENPTSLQLVSLPASKVDWPKTAQYTESVRSAHYAATRGEADYAALTAEIARVLTELSITAEPLRRLTMAIQARRYLQEWSSRHYGYRAADVQELVSLLDESVSSARASAGHESFELSLVTMARSKDPPLLPVPSIADSIVAALSAARAADVPSERLSLRQAVLLALVQHRDDLPEAFRNDIRRSVAPQVQAGLREEQTFSRLRERVMKDAAARAVQGDVGGVERVLARVRKQDARLGRSRPQDVQALTLAVESQIETARTRRLVLDQYAMRSETFRAYRRQVRAIITAIESVGGDVDAVKAMSGPRPRSLPGLIERLEDSGRRLTLQDPPLQLQDSHAALRSAVQLMSEAFRMRLQAVISNDLQLARNASSAAAGSLLLLARAKSDIDQFFSPPQLQ